MVMVIVVKEQTGMLEQSKMLETTYYDGIQLTFIVY